MELKEKYGFCHTTCGRVLRAAGVVLRPKNGRWRGHIDRDQMVRDYQDGLSLAELAVRYHCCEHLCSGELKKRGVQSRSGRRTFLPLDRPSLILDYQNGMTSRAVASKHHCSMQTVLRELRRQKIDRREALHREYKLNESFFERIDTEAKAYWLGFLTADVYSHGYAVALRLQRRDEPHLIKFRSALLSDHPIYRFKAHTSKKPAVKGGPLIHGGPSSELYIGSLKMVGDLKKLGLGIKKTRSVKPTKIPCDLLRHYWRGIIDGDGCIHRDRVDRCQVRLTGNKAVTKGFVSFLSHNGIKVSWYPISYGGLVATGGNGKPAAILRLLYHGATVFLDRKKALADAFLYRRV